LKLRNQLLEEFNIEIAGGIGATKGQIWRLGLMGYCSQKQFVLELLGALDKALVDQGHRHEPGAGVGAAIRHYSHAEVPALVGH
jgi:alanine-glyoxylate transaminase/serine-glyoxylate transaminase/serine-pyruvate transaminase